MYYESLSAIAERLSRELRREPTEGDIIRLYNGQLGRIYEIKVKSGILHYYYTRIHQMRETGVFVDVRGHGSVVSRYIMEVVCK